jgi:hypothetical protein
MQKNKIEVSKEGMGKTLYIPLCVFRAGKTGFTISCSDPDPKRQFKFGTTPEQLQKFRDKIADLFEEMIEIRGQGQ